MKSEDDLPCHRCGAPLVCSVTVPHSFLRGEGVEVHGVRTIGLCVVCDREKPGARALIDHITKDGELAAEELPAVAALLREWIEEISPARIDDADLTAFRDVRRAL